MRSILILLAAGLMLGGPWPTTAQPAPETQRPATTQSSPEIQRPAATPQAVGALHTLRAIPEACIRFEGAFTGDAARPYRLETVATSPQCQPRARLVEFAQARPAEADGWKFNDLVRVPSAECLSQAAVLRVWRKPGTAQAPALDGQGRSRIYLEEARRQAQAGELPANLPLFAADLQVEGSRCR